MKHSSAKYAKPPKSKPGCAMKNLYTNTKLFVRAAFTT